MSPDPKTPTGGHHDHNDGNDAERDVQFLRDALRPYDIAAFDRGVRPAPVGREPVGRAPGRARTTGLWVAGVAAAVAAVITVPVVIGQNGSADLGPAGTGGAGTGSAIPTPTTGAATQAPASESAWGSAPESAFAPAGSDSADPSASPADPAAGDTSGTGPFQQVTWQTSWLADDGRPAGPITYQRWSTPGVAMLQWSDADHPQESFCFAGYAEAGGVTEQGSGPAIVIAESGVPGGWEGPVDMPATEVPPGETEADNDDAVLTDEVTDPTEGPAPSPDGPQVSEEPRESWNPEGHSLPPGAPMPEEESTAEPDETADSGDDHDPCPTANKGLMLVDPFDAEVPVAAPEMSEFLLDGSNALAAFEGLQARPGTELTPSRAADAATMLVFERHLTTDQQAALAQVVLDLADDPVRVGVPGADDVLAISLDGGEGIGGQVFSPDMGFGEAVLLVSRDRHSVVGTGRMDGTELASWNLITGSGITDVPPAGF